MAGTLVAAMLVLLTVYMPHDFGFWYLWSIGAASGLSGGFGLGNGTPAKTPGSHRT